MKEYMKQSAKLMDDMNYPITRMLLAMIITALAIMAAVYLIYAGGLVRWIASILVVTSQTTGLTDFNSLYAGFVAAIMFFAIFTVELIHSLFGWVDTQKDLREIIAEIEATAALDRKNRADLEEQIKYLYEREIVRECKEDSHAQA